MSVGRSVGRSVGWLVVYMAARFTEHPEQNDLNFRDWNPIVASAHSAITGPVILETGSNRFKITLP
jgi:hypothetical protein